MIYFYKHSQIYATMKNDSVAGSFWDLERDCEFKFSQESPFWHLYTDGRKTDMIFSSKNDMVVGMNLMAISALAFPNIKVYTFELMNNHVHIILKGPRDDCERFFALFKSKLARFFSRNGRTVNLRDFNCNMIEIATLQALRNEIVYTNRNGFVAIPSCTPYSYPWGAGAFFFNPFLSELRSVDFGSLSVREKRAVCHSNKIDLPDDLKVCDGVIMPSSYCCISEAEGFFRNAHHYFQCLTRKYEAYSEIADRLHESIFITDEEMYSAVCALCVRSYNVKHPGHLPAKDKVDMARRMKQTYNASNRQIKNILKLEKDIVDELFPESK